MWVVKICKLCIYALSNFIDQSEAGCCWQAGVCHWLCSLAYCFSHCALDFPHTHPIVILPCLQWRRLLAGFCFQAACLCLLTAWVACLPSLWLFARSRAIDPPSLAACRVLGCLPMCVSVHQHI